MRKTSGEDANFFVVGIGASAGDPSALRDLCATIDDAEGRCLIVVQHVARDHPGFTPEFLREFTKVPVFEPIQGGRLEAGRIYLIPPHQTASIVDHRMRLSDAVGADARGSVVDHLLISLAHAYADRAIGIVLSDLTPDGTVGVAAVNEHGGLTMAHAAIRRTGESVDADHALKPGDMWPVVTSRARYFGDRPGGADAGSLKDQINSAVTSICEVLHQKTKHDFKHYKTSTLVRRIQRRLQVLQITSADAYLERLRETEEEADRLFKELLINVTWFFRDPDAFAALRTEVLSPLMTRASPGQKIRVWVPGCSTGEEPYSIAMLVLELLAERGAGDGAPPEVQIIATDIDDAALAVARRGAYPAAIAEHVDPSRLERFFTKRAGRYHVRKELREMCLFSIHNLITDPPYSQVDVISCRNVLIYLGSHLQSKLFPVFHYALRPHAHLFLGSSETHTAHKELFRPIDGKQRISQRKPTAIKLPSIKTSVQSYVGHYRGGDKVSDVDLNLISQRIALDEMPLRYAVVNDELQILSSSAGIAKYVQVPEGAFHNNVLKLVTPSLRAPLRAAFDAARRDKRKTVNDTCTLKTGDEVERIAVIVQPMPQLGDLNELYWVAFQNMGVIHAKDVELRVGSEDQSELIEQLERELATARQELDRTVQDLEASNEELKSSNEELLAINEELQSANEELETSKEDVQSSNEALQHANLDLENLLASTQIATLFLDDAHRIRSFTPAVQDIYNVRPDDVGRRITDFTSRSVAMPELPASPFTAPDGSAPEVEIPLPDGRTLLRRILPYRTAAGARDGIVVTFVDVSELRRSEGRFLKMANSVPVITWTASPDGAVQFFNSRWYEYTGQVAGSAQGWAWNVVVHPDDFALTGERWSHALATGDDYVNEYRLRAADGSYRWHSGTAVAFRDDGGSITGWFGTCLDIQDQKEKTDLLEQSGRSLRTIVEAIPQYVWRTTPDGAADYASERFCEYVQLPADDVLGWGWVELVHPGDRERVQSEWAERRDRGEAVTIDFRIRRARDADFRWVRSEGNPFFDAAGKLEKYYGTWTDIHERVKAEADRFESESRFRIMADTAPVLIWMAGPDLRCSWFNRCWLEWTGHAMADEIGGDWADGIHPEDREACARVYAESFAHRTEFNLEYRQRHHSGEYRWLRDKGVPRFTADGRFEGFIGGCMDIHDQKRATDAIQSSEAHFRMLVDRSPAKVWITDRDAKCTYLSKQWYETTGRTPEQDLGYGWIEAVHPDDRARVKDVFFRAVEAKGNLTSRYRLRNRHGQYRWMIDTGRPLTSPTGDFEGYIGTVIDNHDQILTSADLAEVKARFDRSAAATNLGVWYCDLPFDKLIWNAEVRAHFSVGPEEDVTIDTFYGHVHADDRERIRAAIARSIAEHAPYDELMRTIDPDDPSKPCQWVRAIGWTDYDEDDAPIRFDGITLNTTVEHDREAELLVTRDDAERARAAAEIASESKTRFLANMSHEIRTPLSAIAGYSDLLFTRRIEDAEARRFVERISRNSAQLGRLIDELLDLSKIEANKVEIELSPTDVDAVIDDVFSAMHLTANAKGLALTCHWTTPRPARAVTDSVRLTQILTNVVGNAVKFTESGGVAIAVTAGADQLSFLVEDSGIGLGPEQIARLFEPFNQADASVTRKYGGTGLGLALSRNLARLLGGSLTLERSEPGRGSTFRIDIALNADAATAGEGKAPNAAGGVPSLTGRRILMVDDSPDNRTIIDLYLSAAGAKVTEATNGEEGVRQALAGDFDLVLMDIQMPVMDGYQALYTLRQAGYARPVIAITAHAFREERDRCLRLGFADYLTKPIDRSALLKSLAKFGDAQ